jgi:hypothetical protein
MRHAALLSVLAAVIAQGADKPRLIVLTDIGGDPDDQQSMIRLMTYANEFDIEGLIASASGTPGELRREVVQPQLIRDIVEAYEKVRPNLMVHREGYPPAERLLRVIRSGSPQRGVAHLGADRDTEASRWIIVAVDRPDSRPLNIAIWGGAHDLAQALWRVRKDRTPAAAERFVSKLRVHSIGHQDDTGPWIVENFPVFFILSSIDAADVLGKARGTADRRQSVYRGIYLGGDESLTSRDWIDANVRNAHGPLGALYPPRTWTAPNPHGVMKEGDTPSWFYFLRNGLSDSEHPDWGSWGGRFRRVRDSYFNDAEHRVGDVRDARATVWRWRPAFQNEFAARMDWCVQPERRAANHPPLALLNGNRSVDVLRLDVRTGSEVRLSARGSSDPDRDSLTYHWFHYREPTDARTAIELRDADTETLSFATGQIPGTAEVHILLEVKDSGRPALTSYRRAVVRVAPAGLPQRQRERR